MNKLELLPKSIDYKGSTFFLQVAVTAWGHLCICYKELDKNKKILSYVVEKNKDKYIPTIIEETETSGLNEEIGNCPTLDECITAITSKINELSQKRELQAVYHD